MVVWNTLLPLLEGVVVFLLSVGTMYGIKACIGYVLWWARDSAPETPLEVAAFDKIRPDEPVKIFPHDRVTAARLSTFQPRWLISTAAVESLSEPQQRCLLSHVTSHLRGRGRLIHNSATGFAFVLVVYAPQLAHLLPAGVRSSVPVPGLTFAIGYVLVCLPLIERWVLYRGDRRAAAACGIETYLGFLETAARVEPPRTVLNRYFEPSPRARVEKLRDRVTDGANPA